MTRVAHFLIGFRDENHGTVLYQHLAGEQVAGDYLAAVSFALFALRSWRNMGNGNGFATASVALIHTLSDPLEALEDVNALPHSRDSDLSWIAGVLKGATPIGSAAKPLGSLGIRATLESRKNRQGCPEFQLTGESSDASIRRGFVGTVEARGGGYTLHLDVKGFGILGSGLNYYAPAAVSLLLHHLATSVVKSKTSRDRLGDVARQTAKMWIVDDGVGMGNQPGAVMELMSQIWADR